MDSGTARFWLDLIQWAFTVAVGVYAWLSARQRATSARVESLETRVLVIEQTSLKAADMKQVERQLGVLAEQNGRMSGQLESMDAHIRLIQSHLLSRSP